jgi:hypothetical protein
VCDLALVGEGRRGGKWRLPQQSADRIEKVSSPIEQPSCCKRDEITCFQPLPATVADLVSGLVVTSDALCRRRHNASYEDMRIMPI